ncbi:Splicing factor, partial [Ascosphaera atra]
RAPASLTPVLDRATRHCPWSGTLWSQSILNAEREGNGFDDISRIKHRATHTGVLESAGVNELAKVWTTYCSYLHRRAFQADSTDEHHGMAEVGIRSALEDIRRIYDRNKRSVPAREALLRLERVYIQYLSDSGSYDTARERFKQLIGPQGHSYDFWLSYYHWELQCWAKFSPSDGTSTQRHTDPPGYATAVLKHALERAGTDLDWPEKIFSTYFAHCEDYETADELQAGAIAVRRALRELQKRRRKEMAARFSDGRAALAAPADAPVHPGDLADAKAVVDPVHQLVPDIKLHHAMKRKYGDGAPVSAPEVGAKRSKQQVFKQEEEQEQTQVQEVQVPPKRDRENASVIARGLPANVTADQVTKRFFRDVSILCLPTQPSSSLKDVALGP